MSHLAFITIPRWTEVLCVPNPIRTFIPSMNTPEIGSRRSSPEVVCWTFDHWVARSNPCTN